jgi:hypothetical protein|eukprot:jgi/Chrpa1/5463/Chrysochromulina_OHIO_Genome00002909-RA
MADELDAPEDLDAAEAAAVTAAAAAAAVATSSAASDDSFNLFFFFFSIPPLRFSLPPTIELYASAMTALALCSRMKL